MNQSSRRKLSKIFALIVLALLLLWLLPLRRAGSTADSGVDKVSGGDFGPARVRPLERPDKGDMLDEVPSETGSQIVMDDPSPSKVTIYPVGQKTPQRAERVNSAATFAVVNVARALKTCYPDADTGKLSDKAKNDILLAVTQCAQVHDFALVLDSSGQTGNGNALVLISLGATDLTNEVIQRLRR